MFTPAPVPKPADIGLYWTDEEICILLEKIMCGSRLPDNVIPDVNPFQVLPSNLPDGMWYLIVRSEEKKDTEIGYWKAKGEDCEIFSNSAITGWRTTLQFYEGQATHRQRTDWVMQKYRITWKELRDNSKPKDSRSLCRVFLTDGQSPDNERLSRNDTKIIAGGNHFHSIPSTVANVDRTSGQGSKSKSQEKNSNDGTGPLIVAERLPDPPIEILSGFDCISRGDYMELDDLADSLSPSSSSDNSTCLSFKSDDYFDSSALLRDLANENQDHMGKDASCKFSVSASVKPNEVVVHPAALGSRVCGNGNKKPAEGTQKHDYSLTGIEEQVILNPQKGCRNEGMPNYQNVATSSSSHKAISNGEKNAFVGRMKKLKKKYFCFMSF